MKKSVFIIVLAMMLGLVPAFAENTVTLATLEWEPYIGSHLRNKGYVCEIVTKAFERAGYAAETKFFPWARAVMIAEQGQADALFPEYYDEKRKEKFVYSDPFPGGPVGLCKRKDNPATYPVNPTLNQTEALRGLRQYDFGVVRGYVNTKEFDAADFLKKDEATDDEMNLKKLFNKRIHFIFIDKYVAKHIIATKLPMYRDDLEFMEPPLEVKPLYIAFSKQAKGYEEKLAAFNRGLKLIREDGTLDKIILSHGL